MNIKSILCLALFIPALSSADNIIRVHAPIALKQEQWIDHEQSISEWAPVGDLYGCAQISPRADLYGFNQTITQTFSGCNQDESRTIQATEKNVVTGEVRPKGQPVTETRTLSGKTGTRETQGTLHLEPSRYAITPGSNPSYGAGYMRQNGGVYNFGTSMQKTASGHQMFFSVITYHGSMTISVRVATTSALNISGAKADVSALSPFIKPYSKVRLIMNNGEVLSEFELPEENESLNFYMRYSPLTLTEYNFLYSNMNNVVAVELAQ